MSNAAISNVLGVVLIAAWLAITGFTFSRSKETVAARGVAATEAPVRLRRFGDL
jgi:hypothetical protein